MSDTEVRITVRAVGDRFHVEADSDSRDTIQLTVCHTMDDVLDQIRETLTDPDFEVSS